MTRSPLLRATTAPLLCLALVSGPALARQPEAPAALPSPTAAPPLEQIQGAEDAAARMSVPVFVNGQGPFRFTIDTGADHSVVSVELAQRLGLKSSKTLLVHGVNGAQPAPAVEVATLEMGTRKLHDVALPALARSDLGSDGILGLDALVEQRVVLDLAKSRLSLERSRGIQIEPGDIVVRAKSRHGQLVMVDSSVRSKPVYVILDSGSEVTIANSAFRTMVEGRRRAGTIPKDRLVDILSVTGQTSEGASDLAPELTLSGVQLQRVPVVYADLHTFRQFGFQNEPTVLLGMDVLRAFRRVDVDFGRREVRFGFNRDSGARPAMALGGTATRLR